jgi:GcrA cell cycle regulator
MTGHWNEITIARMIKLKEEGKSMRTIGEILGFTKNAVIGKLWRLGKCRHTAPSCEFLALGPAGNAMACTDPHACLWPYGDPKKSGFHFCGAKRVEGRPYCDEHMARAYVEVGLGSAA